ERQERERSLILDVRAVRRTGDGIETEAAEGSAYSAAEKIGRLDALIARFDRHFAKAERRQARRIRRRGRGVIRGSEEGAAHSETSGTGRHEVELERNLAGCLCGGDTAMSPDESDDRARDNA